MRKLWLIEFLSNALLIFLFYEWLGIRDSRISQIVLSFALGLAILAGAVWLHSQTFNEKPARFALLASLFLIVCWGLSALPISQCSLWLASTLTFLSRKVVTPAFTYQLLDWLRFFTIWILTPLLLLQRRNRNFWLQYTAVVLIAFLAPWRLIHWIPKFDSTTAQTASFLLRFGLAYCLAITGCVALARLSARTPRG